MGPTWQRAGSCQVPNSMPKPHHLRCILEFHWQTEVLNLSYGWGAWWNGMDLRISYLIPDDLQLTPIFMIDEVRKNTSLVWALWIQRCFRFFCWRREVRNCSWVFSAKSNSELEGNSNKKSWMKYIWSRFDCFGVCSKTIWAHGWILFWTKMLCFKCWFHPATSTCSRDLSIWQLCDDYLRYLQAELTLSMLDINGTRLYAWPGYI